MTTGPVADRHAMVAGMNPSLRPGAYAFVLSDDPGLMADAFTVVREDEGTTLVVLAEHAAAVGLPVGDTFACITLNVHSALEGVGLTAAVSAALADASIPANVIAGYHHDHIFVPSPQAQAALEALKLCQQQASAS